jgi:transposase
MSAARGYALEAHERRLAMTKCTSTKQQLKGVSALWEKVTTIGLDLGDRSSQYCAVSAEGEILAETRVNTTVPALQAVFGSIGRKRIIIETGTHSPWVSRLLTALGHEVIVANARKLRMIYENKRKNDRVDARTLARVGRMDPELLGGIQHRSERAQAHLEIIRARDVLVATRTRLANHVRGATKPFGIRLPRCSPSALIVRASGLIPPDLLPSLNPLLEMIASVSVKIREYDRRIEQLADHEYPESEALRQVCGVGALTSLAFMLTVGDAHRFTRSRKVGPWLGLVPGSHDSGESEPQMHITKEGDQYVRRLLVGSAQYMLGPFGPDCDLRRWGQERAARGGKNAKRRATVAVARKLAVLLHRLWVTQAVYEPFRAGLEPSVAA